MAANCRHLPSDLSDKFAADSKPATTLVLNAHGTQNIFLLFVDEKIYKERKLSPK
jgi:hypothetical protein